MRGSAALDKAMASGQGARGGDRCRIFKQADGKLTGPLAPFLPLAEKYGDRILLLPHAAADTDHGSRVAGAMQAVDQIFDVIRFRKVANVKGDIPEGYHGAGPQTVAGVGKVTNGVLTSVVADKATVSALRKEAEEMAALWAALDSSSPARAAEQIKNHGAELTAAINRYQALTRSSACGGRMKADIF